MSQVLAVDNPNHVNRARIPAGADAPSLRELLKRHRKWAMLTDEILRLDIAVDDLKAAARSAETRAASCARVESRTMGTDDQGDPGIAALERQSRKTWRDRVRECEALKMGVRRRLEAIERGPDSGKSEAFPLFAILLDIALDCEIDLPWELDGPSAEWKHLRYLVGALMRFAPQVELTSLRHELTPRALDRLSETLEQLYPAA